MWYYGHGDKEAGIKSDNTHLRMNAGDEHNGMHVGAGTNK